MHLRSRSFELVKICEHAISVRPEITHTVTPFEARPIKSPIEAFPYMTLAKCHSRRPVIPVLPNPPQPLATARE
jgi:hypothetical protein